MKMRYFFLLVAIQVCHFSAAQDWLKNIIIRVNSRGGKLIDGVKEGEWIYYYPSGKRILSRIIKMGPEWRGTYFYPTETFKVMKFGRKGKCRIQPGTFYKRKIKKQRAFHQSQYDGEELLFR